MTSVHAEGNVVAGARVSTMACLSVVAILPGGASRPVDERLDRFDPPAGCPRTC
jgi:hypothetical protein